MSNNKRLRAGFFAAISYTKPSTLYKHRIKQKNKPNVENIVLKKIFYRISRL